MEYMIIDQMKNVYITGIAGFIGYHLAKALHARGDRVAGCDNFNDYYDPALKKERATQLAQLGIEVKTIDITKKEGLPLDQGITHLVHLAAQAGVRMSLTNPAAYHLANQTGFFQVLEQVRKCPHIKLTYASSSSVYGLNKKIPFAETDPTDSPANFYGATKKSNELMAFSYHQTYNLSVTGLRFFTVYGPMGRPDMAYYSFTRAIEEGKPIRLFNEGQLQRDFTYIDDIVDGTIAAIDRESVCEIFNLGNNQPQEVMKLINLIEARLGKKALIEKLPLPPGEIPLTYADITKAKELLNYSPKISLEEGMERFLDWVFSAAFL